MEERQPITFDRFIRGVIFVAIFVAAIALINYLSSVLLPFFIAFGIAYLIYPLVVFFQYKCRLKNRVLSIAITLILAVAIIAGVFSNV